MIDSEKITVTYEASNMEISSDMMNKVFIEFPEFSKELFTLFGNF